MFRNDNVMFRMGSISGVDSRLFIGVDNYDSHNKVCDRYYVNVTSSLWTKRKDHDDHVVVDGNKESRRSSSSSRSDECFSIVNNMDCLLRDELPLEDVRNFCIIAHVDHGKSSLASRVLQITGNANFGSESDKEKVELLNTLSVEKERGVTVETTYKIREV